MTDAARQDDSAVEAPGRPPAPAPRSGRSVSRRGLITGAAGLVVGAGATEAANLFTPGTAPPASGKRPPTPGEALMTEHGLLIRLLVAYRTAAEHLAGSGPPPPGIRVAVADAAAIIADYVHGFHEGLEEAYVFPRVRAGQAQLVHTLLVQHDRGRHLTAAITDARTLDLHRPAARAGLRGLLITFARMYEPHEAREDTVIYPALRDALSQRQLDVLAERFADLENHQYGDAALSQFLHRLDGVEQQLGIADLDAFTPPEPAT